MPVEAMMDQDELYIPISVLTNGLGLQATWDKTKQTYFDSTIMGGKSNETE